MKISNANEFFQFIRSSSLVQLAPETVALVVCMESYGRMCQCDPESARRDKYNQCKSFYIAFAKKAGEFKNQLLSKTADGTIVFQTDGQYLTTITR